MCEVRQAARVNLHPGIINLASKVVLIVDDEENVRSSTAAVLRLHGMQVETAEGISQALQIAIRPGQRLDCVITDLRLRDSENGIQLVSELKMLMGDQIPALLITGDIAPERVQMAQQSGLRVLYKPVSIGDLLDALSELLDSPSGRNN